MDSLISCLEGIDHGAQADIIGDRRSLELVHSLTTQRNISPSLGSLICELAGGAHEILGSKRKRNYLFMALDICQQDEISKFLGVENIFEFTNTASRKALLYELFSVDVVAPTAISAADEQSKVIGVSPKYGLFSHQSKALSKCTEYLESENPRVMLHMPTGSGKTRTSMHLMARCLNQNSKALVVWLVAGKELCEQAADEFQKAWSYLGERPVPIIKLWSDKAGVSSKFEDVMAVCQDPLSASDFEVTPWPRDLNDGVVIASLDSMRSLIDEWEPAESYARKRNVSLIVFDEAHQSVAPTYQRIIETLMSKSAPKTKLIGLTATPGRTHYGEPSDSDNALVQLFQGQFVQLGVDGFDSPIDYLVEGGYLASLDKERLEIANSEIGADQLHEFNQVISDSMDIPDNILKILGYSATRNLQIVERVERLIKEEGHKRIIVFSPSVQSAIVLSNICSALDINSSFVHASSSDRDSVIERFKGDDTEAAVIFNYGVLTTGFDAPKTSVVIIARPTTSLVLLSQMAGRAIRGPKVGGNERAKLITVVDVDIPVLVEPIAQFHAFDASWRREENG